MVFPCPTAGCLFQERKAKEEARLNRTVELRRGVYRSETIVGGGGQKG